MSSNVYFISKKGLREQNEDKHTIIINQSGSNPNQNRINFYAVYDGHGGKKVSEFVETHLHKFFMDKRVQYPVNKQYVNNVYDHVQNSMRKEKFAFRQGSTGLVVIDYTTTTGGRFLNVLNNGDCRCVVSRNNMAHPLTKDHKPHLPEEYRRIVNIGGKSKIRYDGHDWRIIDLSVSRAFGDIDSAPFVTHRPEIFNYKITQSDKFIIIACDGLWDVLSNSDAVNFVLKNCYDISLKKRINQTVNIANKLANYALKEGSSDNVSVIVVFF